MDSTIILSVWHDQRNHTLNLDILDFSTAFEIEQTVAERFAKYGSYDLEIDDSADFPQSLLEWQEGNAPDWMPLIRYAQEVSALEESEVDAFKAYYNEYAGGMPVEMLVRDFKNAYRGDFDTSELFGIDLASGVGINLAGFDEHFNFESFGESALADYNVLEDRYYFRR